MNLRGLLQLAHLGRQVGVDLCSAQTPDGRSIRKALDFLAPYAKGERKWPYQQINGFRPEGALTLLRWVNQTLPSDRSDVDNLVGPRLIGNPQDSN